MIEIEDVHWAAPDVLDQLAFLSSAIAEIPCALVMRRQGIMALIGDAWRAQVHETPITTFDLGPLKAEQARRLAKEFFAADEAVRETCVARSGGNPLFLEQLLHNLDDLSADNLPGTIQGIVQARLDVLDTESRDAVQAAATLGQRFSLEALAFLLGKDSVDASTLLRNALIRPAGNDLYFAHTLIRDGAYETLLKSRRAELHLRAADWFAKRDLILHARHLDLAEDPGAPEAYLLAVPRPGEMYQYDQALPLVD